MFKNFKDYWKLLMLVPVNPWTNRYGHKFDDQTIFMLIFFVYREWIWFTWLIRLYRSKLYFTTMFFGSWRDPYETAFVSKDANLADMIFVQLGREIFNKTASVSRNVCVCVWVWWEYWMTIQRKNQNQIEFFLSSILHNKQDDRKPSASSQQRKNSQILLTKLTLLTK